MNKQDALELLASRLDPGELYAVLQELCPGILVHSDALQQHIAPARLANAPQGTDKEPRWKTCPCPSCTYVRFVLESDQQPVEDEAIALQLQALQEAEHLADKCEEALYEAASEEEVITRWHKMKAAQAHYLEVKRWFESKGLEPIEEVGNNPAEHRWIVKATSGQAVRRFPLRHFRTFRE